VAAAKQAINKATNSVGFLAKLVTVTSVTTDGLTALTTDRMGTETQVPMLVQRSKGPLPQPGETWLIDQALGAWTFAAFSAQSDAQFAGGAGGTDGGTEITVSPTPPASPVPGQLWINSAGGNELFRWGGSSWTGTQWGTTALADSAVTAPKIRPGSVTSAQIAPHAGITAQQVAFSVTDIGGVKVTTGTTQPRDPAFGDIWFDPDAGNMMSIWNGNAWVPYQFGAGAIQPGSLTGAQISDAPTIGPTQVNFTATDIGGVSVSISDTPPPGPAIGDLWFDGTSEYELKQWTGSAWAPFQFGGQAIAPDSIGTSNVDFTARDIGGITTTVGSTQPTSPVAGDLWYDAAHGFLLNQFDGAAWNPYQYGTGAIAAGSVTAALIAANTITASQIAAGTITATQIASATITAGNIAAGTITASNIAANTITAALIAANTITAAQIAAGTITTSQIAAGTITAQNLAVGGAANFNPYFAGGALTGWTAFHGTLAAVQPAGAPYPWAAQLTPSGTGTTPAIEGTSGTGWVPVVPGLSYLVSAIAFTPAGTVTIGFDWYNSSGVFMSTSAPSQTVTPSAWSVLSTIQTAPAGAAFGIPRVGLTGTPPPTTTLLAEAITVLSPLNGGIIEAGTIAAAQIAAGTITATQIAAGTITVAQLAAGLVVAGIIDGTVVTGATLQNSTSDPRTAIHPDGSITITNSGGTVIFKVGPDGTTSWFSSVGQLQAAITPAGDFLVYQSPQGPQSWDFEPPSYPQLVATPVSSTVNSSTYAAAVTQDIPVGSYVEVIANASGATAASLVTDSKGNTYSLVSQETSGEEVQVFACAATTTALTVAGSDSITTTFAASNAQCKNIFHFVMPGITSSNMAVQAFGSSAAATVSGTPVNLGDLVMVIISNGLAGGVPVIPAQWALLAQSHTGSNQYTSVLIGSAQNLSALTGSAAFGASCTWTAMILGFTGAGVGGTPWTSQNATLMGTAAWSGTGQFSLGITHSNTTQPWGATSPQFPVTAGSPITMSATVEAPSALTAQVALNFYNSVGTLLSTITSDQGASALAAGGSLIFTVTGAVAPVGATQAAVVVSSTTTTTGLILNVDTVVAPGGLVYSNSAAGGIDSFDNPYSPGVSFIGLPLQENIFQVISPYGQALATIDSGGNVAGQVLSAAEDILIGGQSFESEILPGLASGIVAMGSLDGNLPAPATPTVSGTETAIMELDVNLTAGRCYMLNLSSLQVNLSTAGRAQLRVHATADGSTPTTSSANFMSSFVDAAGSNRLSVTPAATRIIQPVTDFTLRMLLTLNAASLTVAGTTTSPTGQIAGTADSATFGYIQQGALCVYDLGNAVPNTGVYIGSGSSGTSGGQTFTDKTFADATWSYYGPGATFSPANTLRRHNNVFYEGPVPVGGGVQAGSPGNCYTYLDFTNSSLATVLAGATINSITLTLSAYGGAFSSGTDIVLGYSANASKNSPTSGVTHVGTFTISAGQTKTITLPNSVAVAFQSGAAVALVIGGTGDAKAVGSFQGTGSGQGPYLTINYTT
jgi:hypothetical protein